MQFKIEGDNMPVVTCKLEEGESVYTQTGGMAWMSETIKMDTKIKGGLGKGILRKLTGESFFVDSYRCMNGTGEITFSTYLPGSIIEIELKEEEEIICQKTAFICAESTIDFSLHFQKKISSGFFGGEGFMMQKIRGPGKVFLEIDGSCIKKTLADGEKLIVEPGYVAAYVPSVEMGITTTKGLKNIVFGGESFFMANLTGPGDVYLQTNPITKFITKLVEYMPREKKESEEE